MLLIMSQLLLLPTKQPRYCRQPGKRIKTKHKTESSSSGGFFSHPPMAKRTLKNYYHRSRSVQTPTSRIVHYVDFYLVICYAVGQEYCLVVLAAA